MTIQAGCQVSPAAALAKGPVAIRAVRLEERISLLDVPRGFKRIVLWRRSPIRSTRLSDR